jgi:hypothetical protein
MYKHIIHNILPVIIDFKFRAIMNWNLEYHHKFKIFRRIASHHIWPCNFYFLILSRHSFLKPPIYTQSAVSPMLRETQSVYITRRQWRSKFCMNQCYAWQLFLMARPTAVVGLSQRPRCGLVWGPNIGYRSSKFHASPAASTAIDTCDVHSVMQPSLHMF